MSILNYLREGIYSTIEFDGDEFEIYDDPSRETIDRIIAKAMYKDVRLAIDASGEIYAWDGWITHMDAVDKLPTNIKWTLHWTNLRTPRKVIGFRHDANPQFEGRDIDNATFKKVVARLKSLFDDTEWIELMNTKSIGADKLKILKQYFPNVIQHIGD